MRKDNPPEVLVITLPCMTMCSASQRQGLSKHTKQLPIKLPKSISPGSNTPINSKHPRFAYNFPFPGKSGFPWIISVTDLSCYTLQLDTKLYFLKPLSVNATVGVSSKSPTGSDVDRSEISLKRDSSTSLQFHDCESDIGPLAICVHVDMTSINVSMSEIQVRNTAYFVRLSFTCLLADLSYRQHSLRLIRCGIHDRPGIATGMSPKNSGSHTQLYSLEPLDFTDASTGNYHRGHHQRTNFPYCGVG